MFYLYSTIFFSLAKQIIKAIFVHCVFPNLKAFARLNIALQILALVPKSLLIPNIDVRWMYLEQHIKVASTLIGNTLRTPLSHRP